MTLEKFKNHPSFPVIYMFVAMLFFSSILVGIARTTKGRVEANEQAMFERAVLDALNATEKDTPVREIYAQLVQPPDDDSGGAYRMMKDDKLVAYAVPVSGQGFWDEIKGIIGIEHDMKTVTGIAFYEQKETPGLGAEIVKPEFRNQFRGITLAKGDQPIKVLPFGAELEESEVHAVTGATQTSTKLEKLVNNSLINWLEAVNQ